MSIVRHLGRNTLHRLAARTRLGRGLDCDLIEPGEHASRQHALLSWREGHWWVRDERSRNGTWVDGRRLGLEEVPIHAGQRLGLGHAEPSWELLDEAPPRSFGREEARDQEIEAQDHELVLPSRAGPVHLVQCLEAGGWIRLDDPERRPVIDRSRLHLDQPWDLFLPTLADSTRAELACWELGTLQLHFRVSRTMEHTELALEAAGRPAVWLPAQEIFWPLYLMARARIEDADAPEHDQGWMDVAELTSESGVPRKNLDVYIIRVRERLARAGLFGAEGIVQVRRGQRRIGVPAARLRLEIA